ncbi:outer membrane protein [Helicobacter felis]|uniref:outer membrane protein n=1 Tax=Helicobacter felis TaxID=214 RepID=UPI001F2D298D|nr:outer membrane protein [Helicobacter felis]
MLNAEDSGGYIQGGFQYSNFAGKVTTNSTAYTQKTINDESIKFDGSDNVGLSTARNQGGDLLSFNFFPLALSATTGNLFGVDIQFGYKQFFGHQKRFGARYYGMFSGQGGEFSSVGRGYANQPTGNLFYGVGIDALFNFYEKGERTLGVFAGVMIGGSSWIMGKGAGNANCRWSEFGSSNDSCGITMNKSFDSAAKEINKQGDFMGVKANFSPTFVQFIFNVGLRTNLTKHQGFEFGARIPTIDAPYFSVTNTKGNGNGAVFGGDKSKATISFRRNIALYWNYVYNF